MEGKARPRISFEQVQQDTILKRNGYIVETADLSPEGLEVLVQDHEWAILRQMRTMEGSPNNPDLDNFVPRPAIYIARMAILQSDVFLPYTIGKHPKQFINPRHINDRFLPYWRALSRTHFSVYGGIIEDWENDTYDGVWIGVRQPYIPPQ